MAADAEALVGLVDRDRLVERTRELVAIPSVNPFGSAADPGRRELEVAERYAEMLREVGCDVVVAEVEPGRPNVYGTRRGAGTGSSVLLAGHLDTVGVEGHDDPFGGRIDGDAIHGRGTCDMKGALAAFVEVAGVLDDADVELAGDLIIAGISDEEDRMIGSVHWSQNGPTADHCIVGEPTGLAVCPAHKGQVGMYIRTFGRAVHSSLPEQGVNAIVKMSSVIAAFGDYNDELAGRPAHPLCGTGSFSVGVIRGGDLMSTVPDFCEIEVDRRLVPGETEAQVVDDYRTRLDALAEADEDFRYELVGPTMSSAPLDTPLDNAVVRAASTAVESVTGSRAEVRAFTGGTDAPNLGAPAVILGPGSLEHAHSRAELVPIEELVDAARIYLLAVLDLTAISH